MRKLIPALPLLVLLTACPDSPPPTSAVDGVRDQRPTASSDSALKPLLDRRDADRQRLQSELDRVGDRVFFATDRSELSAEAQTTLRRQADWMQRYPFVTVTIEGHADERGTREYNLALGDRRATAVRKFLLASGIPEDRLHTVSYGKERPAIALSSDQGWAQNRRGVTTVD